MQNTITNCKSARISNHIYSSSDPLTHTPTNTLDFIMCADSDEPSPIISLNNQLPEILLCISRELSALQREKSLCGKSQRLDTHLKAAPLLVWYRSILENIYVDGPIHLNSELHTGQILSSFSLHGEIYQPMISCSRLPSPFYYVTLTLPPLWQKRKAPTVSCAENTASRISSASKSNNNKHCFSFRYCPDTGFWYASVSKNPVRKLKLNKSGA